MKYSCHYVYCINYSKDAPISFCQTNCWFSHVLQLNDKDQSLLDERIKRSLKNKPPPKAKEEERPKTAAPVQPQRSASQ